MKNKIVKAKQPHFCTKCNGVIKRGRHYSLETTKINTKRGRGQLNFRTCPKCMNINNSLLNKS